MPAAMPAAVVVAAAPEAVAEPEAGALVLLAEAEEDRLLLAVPSVVRLPHWDSRAERQLRWADASDPLAVIQALNQ